MDKSPAHPVKRLFLVLGDQLDWRLRALQDFDRETDAVWMAEVAEEATHVWSNKSRIAVFFSAMRHFRDRLRAGGMTVHYRRIGDRRNQGSFVEELRASLKRLRPQRLILTEPGEWRVEAAFLHAATEAGIDLDIRPDRHFLCSRDDFARHAAGRKGLRMEYFYREMRRAHDVLIEDAAPAGGKWNYDVLNRRAFGKAGPRPPLPRSFPPDATTREVLRDVERLFPSHPGRLDTFDWPVTPEDALAALDDFVEHRLALFGTFQDAMWSDEPFLYHACLSSSLNLKLLDPREAIARAETAYRAGVAPLPSVEGFIRQILGWREYVRGVYWRFMPEYIERNALSAERPLPAFYWTAETDMECLRQVVSQTLDYGYAHHIQRLMVTGLFALLLGVAPQAVHAWYLAVYVDAVEWVELPNVLGMSQYADGGIMASKPYAATGKYIDRMSNYCKSCRYRPEKACGEDACPFTTLYWDFLARHRERLIGNRRMALQLRNLRQKARDELRSIARRADAVHDSCV